MTFAFRGHAIFSTFLWREFQDKPSCPLGHFRGSYIQLLTLSPPPQVWQEDSLLSLLAYWEDHAEQVHHKNKFSFLVQQGLLP